MEEVIASPFIPFLFLLIYIYIIQVILEAPVPPPTKLGQFRGSKITVKQIYKKYHNMMVTRRSLITKYGEMKTWEE